MSVINLMRWPCLFGASVIFGLSSLRNFGEIWHNMADPANSGFPLWFAVLLLFFLFGGVPAVIISLLTKHVALGWCVFSVGFLISFFWAASFQNHESALSIAISPGSLAVIFGSAALLVAKKFSDAKST